jgi:phosphate transport system substrate-binding protein
VRQGRHRVHRAAGAFDALTVVINPKNTSSNSSLCGLKKIWEPGAQGKVLKWKDVNPQWPTSR